jgi:lauroyl/myristoyl acyltransferase
MWQYYLFRLALAIVPLLPFPLGCALANLAGTINYKLNTTARRYAVDNARIVLGPGASHHCLNEVVKGMFRASARNYYDLFRSPRIDTHKTNQRLQIIGWQYLEEALANGKGAIIIAPHMGSFEMVLQLAQQRSLTITVPIERLKPEKLFQLMLDLRKQPGVTVLPAEPGALRQMYQALRRNEVVLIAADRDVLGNGVPVRFFGRITTLPDAPAIISVRNGTPILVGATFCTKDNRYIVEFLPAIWPSPGLSGQEAADEVTARVCANLEKIIREHPEQWVALQPVWKDRPDN